MNSNLHFTANMHRGNFAWLFLVILVSDGLQLMICVPVDTDEKQENYSKKSALPFARQYEEALEGDPGSYQDDSEVPDRMYKRIFYTHGLVYNQSPENQRTESKPMDEKKPLPARFREFQASDAEQKLKTLIALRDRAKSIHEDLAHSVLEQEALMENRREQQRKAPEGDKILEGW